MSFEGLVRGYGRQDTDTDDLVAKSPSKEGGTEANKFVSGKTTRVQFYDNVQAAKKDANKWDQDSDPDTWIKEPVYTGAVFRRSIKSTNGTALWELHTKNTGHLGVLDHPDQVDRLHGMHKFTGAAVRV